MPRGAGAFAGFRLDHQPREHLVQRGLQLAAAGRPVTLFGMPRGGHARRLLRHHHLGVEVFDLDRVFAGRGRGRAGEDFDYVFSVSRRAASTQTLPLTMIRRDSNSRCTCDQDWPRKPLAQRGREGLIDLAGKNTENCSAGSSRGLIALRAFRRIDRVRGV